MRRNRSGSSNPAGSAAFTARSNQIKKELRRRPAIEAVIGHCKTDGHLDRNFLRGRRGGQINAVMSAVGYNFRLILRWTRQLLRKIIAAIVAAISPISTLRSAS